MKYYFYLQSLLIFTLFINYSFSFADKTYEQNKLRRILFFIVNFIAVVYLITYPYDFFNNVSGYDYLWFDYLFYIVAASVYLVASIKYIQFKKTKKTK